MAGPAAPGRRPLVLAVCRWSILTWRLRGGRLEKRKAGQGGSGKPPPLAGLLLRVGSPWREVLHVFLYQRVRRKWESAELQCATYQRVMSITLSSRNDCFQDRFRYWHFRSTFDSKIYYTSWHFLLRSVTFS